MGTEDRLVTDLVITVDGNPLPTESGSGRVSGWPPYQREGSASTVGDDAYTETKRVTEIAANLQFTESFDASRLEGMKGVPVSGKQGGRRFIAQRCTLKDVGEIGGGSVNLMIMALGGLKWL